MSDPHQYCSGDFHPDDVVISGISGRFPLCENVGEFKEAISTSRNILIETCERHEKGVTELAFGSIGTVNNIDKFDARYFRFSEKTANLMDPTHRMLLEVSCEAIADAGYDPTTELKGANIGVYTGITAEEGRDIVLAERIGHPLLVSGFVRCMAANRNSHHFDFTGPSLTLDSACSSSMVAIWVAYNDLLSGRVDGALVNTGQLSLNPHSTSLYVLGGVASPTGQSHPFDERANGIVRSEAIVAFFIQKASVARRAYASILHIKHAAAGYVSEGIAVPSYKEEVKLFRDVLRESKIEETEIKFIEAHGTGTLVGDPIEIRALETVYCNGRKEPLLVGSVKSNAGHSEAAAGHLGALKAIFAFETGVIAPNYDFQKPNPNCEALLKETIKIVTEPTLLQSDYIPVNSFGLGGSIVQAMLKRNTVEYSNILEPEDLPRLVLFPGNTKAAVQHMFEYIKDHPELRSEFFALLNKLSFTPTKMKPFRGFALFQNETPVIQIEKSEGDQKREIWFIMTGMGCQWPGMGLEMMQIKVFADSMNESANVLKTFGIDLFELLKKDEKHLLTSRSITPAFVTIVAIQIALVDVLRVLEIHPDHIIGHSTGELICAYADGCCTAEQTILSAYWRGVCVENANLKVGAMAAVGLSWDETVLRCPKDVYPTCHNANDSVTISGLPEPLNEFVAELQKENIFARVVNAYDYAFHCEYVWPAAKELKKVLSKVIRDPKPRTERWLSTSYLEEEWDKEECKIADADYFVNNLMSTVHFSDVLKKVPSDACTIEIGPHFLMQSILKRSIGSNASYIGLMKRNDENNIGFFMESLGKLYMEGLNPKIENLYRPVQFPVPRGTPQISDLIQWDHSVSYKVPKLTSVSMIYVHNFDTDGSDNYLHDHTIDGRALFPATGYLWLAWKALTKGVLKKAMEEPNFVVEDFKIHRATMLTPTLSFTVVISECTGRFEVIESKSLAASGKIYFEDNIQFCEEHPTISETDSSNRISGADIYGELRIAGYQYGPAFRRLVETRFDGKEGFVEWKDNWITFLDALLLFYMFSTEERSFVLPTGILSFKVCPKMLTSCAEESLKEGLPGVPVNFHRSTNICRTAGIEINNLEVDIAPPHRKTDTCVLEEYRFVPYVHNYTPLSNDEKLAKYMIACNSMIDKFQNNFSIDLNSGKFVIEHKIDFDVDTYLNKTSTEMKLLEALKTIAAIAESNGDLKEYEKPFNQYNEDIGIDVVNTLLINDCCLRFMFEIILENTHQKLNVLEINSGYPMILPTVSEMAEGFARKKFKSKNFICNDTEKIDKEKLSEFEIALHSYESLPSVAPEKSQNVIISAINVISEKEAQEHIHLLSPLVHEKGFILLFHKNCILPPENLVASLAGKKINLVSQALIEKWLEEEGLLIVSKISHCVCGNLYLLKPKTVIKMGNIVYLTEDDPAWLDELKDSVVKENRKTWIVSEDCSSSGIVGMANCLRHEPNGENIRCVFVPRRDNEKISLPSFSFEDPFFQEVLEKDLMWNIYMEGCWGSFKNISMDTELQSKVVDHSYVNIKRYGDLSSLVWMESAVNYMEIPDNELVHIYYSALNFKDIMLASGKISQKTEKGSSDKCILGFEFSGRNKYGERVAGVCTSRGIATATQIIPGLCIRVPDNWSLEEAATVPVVYTTCYYALIMRAGLQRRQSILIHSGTGGIGQAAINIALSMDCEIYTTVGSEDKKNYILEHFPRIKPENIGCSRDTSFETMIKKRTNGKGVKVVLNSLADDKFYASIRCVAKGGKFVEIGKYDLAMDHNLRLRFFLKNTTFCGVFLDEVMMENDENMTKELFQLLCVGIKRGVVKPLDRTIFQRDEVEKAFRYMAAGTHIGKVLLKIRDEENEKCYIPTKLRLPAIPITYFYPHKVYIIIGGLGGFGIEVAKWILGKGARNLVLTTRFGARTSHHHLCLKRWEEEGYNVIVSKRNVSIKDEADQLLREVSDIGPVGGIFNSAIVLHDAFLENTNFDHFKEVCAPKADATRNLDSLSRCLCPELDHFVCFSSISCGRGNAGQMNYGYANSVMERVCEERQADGYPGVAIQWGIIGEVGVVHRHMGDDAMIAGVVAQRVKSCLNTLDIFCQLKKPVVCSFVAKESSAIAGSKEEILQHLAKIFGFKDISEFNSTQSFGEMGVDSMVGIEVKHLLDSVCDVNLTVSQIQDMKIADVKELLEKAESEKKDLSTALVSTSSAKIPKSSVHPETTVRLNDVQDGIPVVIFDIECDDISDLRNLAAAIELPVYGLLWSEEASGSEVESLASMYLEKMKHVTQKEAHLVAFSSASIIALQMILRNQKTNSLSLYLTIMNGYSYLQKIVNKNTKRSDVDILYEFVQKYIPSSSTRLKKQLSDVSNFEQQVRTTVDLFTRYSTEELNIAELTEVISTSVKRLKMLEEYAPAEKLSHDLFIIEDAAKLLANDIAEAKIMLAEICTGKITVQRVPDISSIDKDSVERIASALKSVFDSDSAA